MTEEQRMIHEKIVNEFDVILDSFYRLIPDVKEFLDFKKISKLSRRYSEKFKNLCEEKQEVLTSPCLLDEFISSLCNGVYANDFKELMSGITETIRKALVYAKSLSNNHILCEVYNIIREMIITIDVNTKSNNPDYRNRLHELLVFNYLYECDNLEILDIAFPLESAKDCDFRCLHKDGTEILIEVMSIHNIDLTKQDNSETFSDFIKSKVQTKYNSKSKGLTQNINLKILPILNYVDHICRFNPIMDEKISLPAFTIVKNKVEGKPEILLTTIDELSNNICKLKD